MTEPTVRQTLMGMADIAVESGNITEGKYLEIANYLRDYQGTQRTEPIIDLNHIDPDTDNYQQHTRALLLPEEIIGGTQDDAHQLLQSLSRDYLNRKRENERLNENNLRQNTA